MYISPRKLSLSTKRPGSRHSISSLCRSPSKNGTQLPHGDGTCLMTTSVESVAFNSMGPVRLVNFPAMIVHFVRLSSGFIEIPTGKF